MKEQNQEKLARRFVSRSGPDGRWRPFKTKRGGQKQRVTTGGGEKAERAPTTVRLVPVKLRGTRDSQFSS